ncbi:MAG: FHA domain-containing protein [Proteobacteria bacterium]|nr:FHA domain-containing protein [Pseudomonadota bacterium]
MTVRLQLGAAQFRLEGLNNRIFAGRDAAGCQLADPSPTLSRRHAEIYLENDTVYLRDLGSANGSWVDGQQLGPNPVALKPGQQVWLGHVALGVTWEQDNRSTMMATEVPAELQALIAARQQQNALMAGGSMAMPAPSGSMGMPASASMPAVQNFRPGASVSMPQSSSGSTSTPTPGEMAYRRQGANSNGTLLLALKKDTWFNGETIDGYVEFTSTDNQTVASITVELIQFHKKGSSKGHFWDRMLVRQGPWRAANGDVLPLPFSLRIPPGVSMTSRDVYWEIRGYVDINWASDIAADIPIQMRNQDIERLRDGMGSLDYRVVELESGAIGQHFTGEFAPPAHLSRDWGVNKVELVMEYLGANLKVRMKLDRKGLAHDPSLDQVFELGKLRTASQAEINATIKAMLDQLLPKK